MDERVHRVWTREVAVGGLIVCPVRGIELVGRDHCLCGEIRAVLGGDLRLYEQGGS